MYERTHIDLFTGIGGFSLAAQANGVRTIAQCESEAFLRAGLERAWGVPCYPDVRRFAGTQCRGAWLLTAGTPCQPASRAGDQRGKDDDRWLWPETIRITAGALPTWALYENPPGIDDVGLGGIIAEVAGLGYEVGLCRIPACAVNSPQDRDRFWIICHKISMADGDQGRQQEGRSDSRSGIPCGHGQVFTNEAQDAGGSKPLAHRTEPGRQGRDAAGTPGRLERIAEQPESRAVVNPTDGRRTHEPGERPKGRATAERATQVCAVARSQSGGQPMRGSAQGQPGLGLQQLESLWSDFTWVPMPARDGAVEVRRAPTNLHSLAYGLPSRLPKGVGSRLIAALGNAICWPIAAEIIQAMIASEATP